MIKKIKKFGVGTDIESIKRFNDFNLKKDRGFLGKIFTENELKYCFSKSNPAHHLAARFVAKESIIKALFNIIRTKTDYREIEIINDDLGIPKVKLTKKNLKKFKVHLSLSHCKDYAIAFVVVIT